jgi:hypothetical protein
MACISITGRVTRPATNTPMPKATTSATTPPASITRCSSPWAEVATPTGSASRRAPSTRVPSVTGSAT